MNYFIYFLCVCVCESKLHSYENGSNIPRSEFLPLCPPVPPTLLAPSPVLVGCSGVIMPMPMGLGCTGVKVLFIDPMPIPNPPLLWLLLLLWNPLFWNPPIPPAAIPEPVLFMLLLVVLLLLADWNPPNADVDVDRLPSVCDKGGVPAGFCWGCENGGREVVAPE
ncbi:MAG: hypothetical protein BYD32DRAFT_454511 [Podila humilis]|nr:MAG: hypothetical protein BYD32DRAFT_454511 [Podila humilis]